MRQKPTDIHRPLSCGDLVQSVLMASASEMMVQALLCKINKDSVEYSYCVLQVYSCTRQHTQHAMGEVLPPGASIAIPASHAIPTRHVSSANAEIPSLRGTWRRYTHQSSHALDTACTCSTLTLFSIETRPYCACAGMI